MSPAAATFEVVTARWNAFAHAARKTLIAGLAFLPGHVVNEADRWSVSE